MFPGNNVIMTWRIDAIGFCDEEPRINSKKPVVAISPVCFWHFVKRLYTVFEYESSEIGGCRTCKALRFVQTV